jgi:cation transport ATPase
MASNRKSRKRRKARSAGPAERRSSVASEPRSATASQPQPAAPREPQGAAASQPRGYERSRARDEAARSALKPLRPGERPTAVTVGAIAAAGLALANLAALVFGYNSGEDTLSPGTEISGTLLVTGVLALIAYGMWRARYWAVLGMQTLLALTMIAAALALLTAVNAWAVVLVLLILLLSGALFWFLIKAMARIQMPQRPGSQSTGAGR